MPVKYYDRFTLDEVHRNPDIGMYILNDELVSSGINAIINNRGPYEIRLSRGDINPLVDELFIAVEDLITHIQSGVSREEISSLLIHHDMGLATRGYSALNRIFSKEVIEIIDLIHAKADNSKKITSMEIVSKDLVLPWEWLYRTPPQKITSSNDLKSVARHFWGMSYNVARVNPKGSGQTNDKIIKPPKIGLIFDSTLKFGSTEMEWLESVKKEKKISLEILDFSKNIDDWEFIKRVNVFLSKKFDVIHFACHAEISQEDKLSSFFTVLNGREYQIRHIASSPQVKITAPLIFFNACSTGVRKPLETFDFVREFEKAGASNILAVEASVQSQVALNFAQTFYRYLLTGSDLGSAVMRSRIELIEKNNNPADIVTIFYSLYGNPQVQCK